MKAWILGVGVVVDLELKQRVRSTAWYVLLGIFGLLLLIVTGTLLASLSNFSANVGSIVFSTIVFVVLLLGTLVTPALSGGAVNGDRDAGTLATTQVTLVTTGQLIMGKFLASWTAALAFLAIAVPFLLVAVLARGVPIATIVVSLLVTAVELGVIAAIGVGLSAIIQRPIFSVVTTYLVVAALSLGTLLAFALGGTAIQTTTTYVSTSYSESSYDSDGNLVKDPTCDPPDTGSGKTPNFSAVWGLLAANPYVILGDAVPNAWSRDGSPIDAFGEIKYGVRLAQIPPVAREVSNDCNPSQNTQDTRTAKQIVEATVPSWFVGLIIHLAIGVGALLLALRALSTPAKRLARGSRIA